MRRVFLSAFDSCPEVVTTDKSEGHTRLKDVQTQQKNERERRNYNKNCDRLINRPESRVKFAEHVATRSEISPRHIPRRHSSRPGGPM